MKNFAQISKCLSQKHIRQHTPNKSLGQNFLIDKNILNKIVKTADLKKSDVVLEIGPGLGVLTRELVKNVKKVIAVEKDKKLVNICKEEFKDKAEIINNDILKVDLNELGLKSGKYKVVANIPYSITSAILKKFLSSDIKPTTLVLLVQKEVAERIIVKAPQMNLLALSVNFYGEPKFIHRVSKSCFYPKPKVDSAILKIEVKKKFKNIDEEKFFKLIKAGFSSKRKQLKNNLAKVLKVKPEKIIEIFKKVNSTSTVRAEQLSLEKWINLFKEINKM